MTANLLTKAYAGRRVLVTGHTGFKGAWLCLWLNRLGAEVIGISNGLLPEPNVFALAALQGRIKDHRIDIRDVERILAVIRETRPEIVFHLAAQPIVREALAHPFETISVNVMGTAAVLEASRRTPGTRAVVIVTSDKVYKSRTSMAPFREVDSLGGHEPYGASKAAAELIAAVYQQASFHRGAGSATIPQVATARAGNVIGGGDFGRDRLLPDVVRAITERRDVVLRHPTAIRPWQHVLEPLSGYLLLGRALLMAPDKAPDVVNFGPSRDTEHTVRELVEFFLADWGPCGTKVTVSEELDSVETAILRVDSNLALATLGWRPVWNAVRSVHEAALWYKIWMNGEKNLYPTSIRSIEDFTRDAVDLGLEWARTP